jgi:glutathione synthase/RimK-type ligase-like ATP-grasp enzyme
MWAESPSPRPSPREREICEAMGPEPKRGFIFVGIDVIGDYVVEINVTSPTSIRKWNASAVPISRPRSGMRSRNGC